MTNLCQLAIFVPFLISTKLSLLALPVEPSRPSLLREGIGDDHFNLTFVPGQFDAGRRAPVGNAFFVRYRETGAEDDEWQEKQPTDKTALHVSNLNFFKFFSKFSEKSKFI